MFEAFTTFFEEIVPELLPSKYSNKAATHIKFSDNLENMPSKRGDLSLC